MLYRVPITLAQWSSCPATSLNQHVPKKRLIIKAIVVAIPPIAYWSESTKDYDKIDTAMVAEHIAISDAFIGSVAISSISPIIIFSSYDDLAIRPITKEYGIKVGPRTLQYDLSSINLTES